MAAHDDLNTIREYLVTLRAEAAAAAKEDAESNFRSTFDKNLNRLIQIQGAIETVDRAIADQVSIDKNR